MTMKNIVICCWRQPKRYSGILVLIGQFMEIILKRKIESGSMSLAGNAEVI